MSSQAFYRVRIGIDGHYVMGTTSTGITRATLVSDIISDPSGENVESFTCSTVNQLDLNMEVYDFTSSTRGNLGSVMFYPYNHNVMTSEFVSAILKKCQKLETNHTPDASSLETYIIDTHDQGHLLTNDLNKKMLFIGQGLRLFDESEVIKKLLEASKTSALIYTCLALGKFDYRTFEIVQQITQFCNDTKEFRPSARKAMTELWKLISQNEKDSMKVSFIDLMVHCVKGIETDQKETIEEIKLLNMFLSQMS